MKQVGWRLQPEKCPGDIDFIDYLVQEEIHDAFIFHMGPGLHHQVGIQASKLGNRVMALTASPAEDDVYDKMLEKRWLGELRVPYWCQYEDIYGFDPRFWPPFDIVNLFHLGEMLEKGDSRPLDTLSRFYRHLNGIGKIIFYTKSSAWDRIEPIIGEIRGLELEKSFKSLEVWRKTMPFV